MTGASRPERLSIYLPQTAHHGHLADYVEIVARARRAKLAGATVLPGAPLKIVIVDSSERLDAFLATVADLVAGATVTRQPVEILFR